MHADQMTKNVEDEIVALLTGMCSLENSVKPSVLSTNKSSLLIRPRVMVDVSKVDTTMHLFGKKYPFPIAFAPSAMQKLAHPQGEECVALAARKLGINMTLSSQSTTSLEDIAELMPATHDGPERWFQLYMSEQPELSIPLIERAAGKFPGCNLRGMITLM
jgi:isopentenyl diphosphate isomerase/L-lactate dehydrogenase-like FMN-dependent dehydrogenase